jgi:hypothetical protein
VQDFSKLNGSITDVIHQGHKQKSAEHFRKKVNSSSVPESGTKYTQILKE